MPSQPLRRQQRHLFRDGVAPVAALRHVLRVAEPLHQGGPRARDADRIPTGLCRRAGEAVTRQRRDHHVERVVRTRAVHGRIGQRPDDLELFDDRARPAMRDDHRHGAFVLRADVDEVEVHSIDLGEELRQRLQSRLDRAPVVVGRPVASERLHRRELHALGPVVHQFARRPPHRGDATPEIVQGVLRHVHLERADREVADHRDVVARLAGRRSVGHGRAPSTRRSAGPHCTASFGGRRWSGEAVSGPHDASGRRKT